MGISQYPEAGRKFEDLFMLADKALYIAKDKGKNRYIIYRPELHDSVDIVGRQTESGVFPAYIKTLKKVIKAPYPILFYDNLIEITINKTSDIYVIYFAISKNTLQK